MYIQEIESNAFNLLGFETRFNRSNWARELKRGTEDLALNKTESSKIKRANTLSNLGRVLGAIPLVFGQIVGISRIVITVRTDVACYDNSYWNKAKHIARGLTETVGFGFVFTIGDVIFTADRFLSQIKPGDRVDDDSDSETSSTPSYSSDDESDSGTSSTSSCSSDDESDSETSSLLSWSSNNESSSGSESDC